MPTEETLLYRRMADMRARLILNTLGLRMTGVGGLDGTSGPLEWNRACSVLLHAELYLADRLMYQVDREGVIGRHWASVEARDAD